MGHRVTCDEGDADVDRGLYDAPNVCRQWYLEEADYVEDELDAQWKFETTCVPKIKSLQFFVDEEAEGGDRAASYFTYELGGNLKACGCDKSGAEISPNLLVSYDLIRQGKDLTDIDFSPQFLTKD